MAPPRDSLTFLILWNRETRYTNQDYVSACQKFFDSLRCISYASVDITEVRRRPSGSTNYEGQLHEVRCTVTLDQSISLPVLTQLYAEISRRWCSAGQSPIFLGKLHWLMPDRNLPFPRRRVYEHYISPVSISFGTFITLDLFAECHAIKNEAPHARESLQISSTPGFYLLCTFVHDERILEVDLSLCHASHCFSIRTEFKLRIPYGSILRMVVNDDEEVSTTDIYLHLRTIPLVTKKDCSAPSLFGRGTRNASFNRVLELGCSCVALLQSRDLGACSVIKLPFYNRDVARSIVARVSRRCWKSMDFAYSPIATMKVESKLKQTRERLRTVVMPKLEYPCFYALNAVFEQGNEAVAQMSVLVPKVLTDFVQSLVEFSRHEEGACALEQALFVVRAAIEEREILNVHTAVPELFQRFHETYVPPKVPPGSSLVRRVFVTPSRTFFLPPTVQCENRVIRRFDSEYSLRVSFRDDNLQQLSHTFMFHPKKEAMMDKIVAQFLRQGVRVGDREFKLLATSCSQLRDHGVWLYAKDKSGDNAESIRKWMGDFSKIPSIAKKMARMGQCFSSTEESVKVPLDGVSAKEEEDIVGGVHPESGRPFTFSDGIGMISTALMMKVCKTLNIAKVPSAIQIRYAGYKGMLCENPMLEGETLVLRKSMNKFECHNSDSLELIKVSAPRTVYLNRPLIAILDQLGVPGEVFLCMQQSMVLLFADALVNEAVALQVVRMFTQVNIPFRRLQQYGFHLTQDPFIRSILSTIYKSCLDGLRSKSRIAVPPNKGRNMFGVLDETGTLEYGQVFVQYTQLDVDDDAEPEKKTSETHILTETVLVTKCPCLHPGDVRKFTAVDVPALRHIKDCIVFPSKGPRPHPNEMAGSDLDGDEYIVIWEKDLFFPGSNRDPMVFSDSASASQTHHSLEEGMIQFICKYILNDSVGIMSSAHMAWADNPDFGIFSSRCTRIARKISTCLDFAKTGESSFLEGQEKPQDYPDFMEKGSSKDTYRSKRILGQLYRIHRSLNASISTDFQGPLVEGDAHRALFEYPGWKKYEAHAEKAKKVYMVEMEHILRQYGIKSEGEVVTGLIINMSDFNKGKLDRTNIEVLVEKQYGALVKSMRQRLLDDAEALYKSEGVDTDAEKVKLLLQLASAWYMVTYNSVWQEANSHSFPWSISDVLLLVVKATSVLGAKHHPVQQNILIAKLDATLTRELLEKAKQDVAFDVVLKWADKEGLIKKTGSGPGICKECLTILFQKYISMELGSDPPTKPEDSHVATDQSHQDQLDTVGACIVGFLRHVSSTLVKFPSCYICNLSSAQTHALTMTALRTYNMLAVSRDLCHLGLPCSPDLHHPMQDIQEGNPIRIKVTCPSIRQKLERNKEEISKLFESWSGVQEVNIKFKKQSSRYQYLLISSVGRDWQCWFLEELLFQPWIWDAVRMGDYKPFLST